MTSAAGAWRAVATRARRLRSLVVGSWQHSLQLRVATTTLLVTGLVVLMIGIFIVDQVAEGVLRAKRDAAIQQANVGLDSARAQFRDVDSSDVGNVAGATGSQVIISP